jgi:hypothetical protein
MAPPPTQQGKFKPRKPATKKVNPGASAATAPAATPTVVAAAAAAAAAAADPGRGDGRGGRGRGRDGRGRGRGRGPAPQGKVFFTATPRPATSSSTRRSASASASASSPVAGGSLVDGNRAKAKQASDQDPSEEVVGQLDNAIGSSKAKRSGEQAGSILDTMDYEDQNESEMQGRGGRNNLFEGITYDSDSSQEEERKSRKSKHSTIMPSELPFPIELLPLGIGSNERPVMYECQDMTETQVSHSPLILVQEKPKTATSPFVDTKHKKDIELERNSWFLVQFPTRLPPLQQNTPDAPITQGEGEEEETETAAKGIPIPTVAEVATPPVVVNSFDNSLWNAVPGRLGKLVVYKSGKTVLVLEGPDGSQKVGSNAILFATNHSNGTLTSFSLCVDTNECH